MLVLGWTLQTGFGTWNPLIWLAAMAVAVVIALVVRAMGRKDFREGSGQTKSFLSGNDEGPSGSHIPASNLYWGFLESLKSYYQKLVPLHTGVALDYLLWFLGVLAIMLIVGFVI